MTFKVGDRVRVIPATSGRYTYPLRNWVAAERGATVRAIFTPEGDHRVVVKIEFDTSRRPKNPEKFVVCFAPYDLEYLS